MRVRFRGLEVGHTSGRPGDVLVTGFDPTYPELRVSDSPREGRDGVSPGRDFFGGRTMTLELATNRSTMVEARTTAGLFIHAWRDASVRLDAGVLVPLEFQAVDDPRWRRVWGRPRRVDDPNFDKIMRQGNAKVTCEFEVMDPRVFSGGDDGEFQVRLGQVEESVGAGFPVPTLLPASSAPVAGTRVGSITVGGRIPTPAVITFHGPGRRLALDGNRGWHVGLKESVRLAYDESITIDPLAGTVVDNWGNPRFGALDKRTDLDEVPLVPGTENVFFSALDDTRQAFSVIRWREAYMSL